MHTPKVDFIIKCMKLAYRLCEAENVHFSKWEKDEHLEMEMAIHLDSLLEEQAQKILLENSI